VDLLLSYFLGSVSFFLVIPPPRQGSSHEKKLRSPQPLEERNELVQLVSTGKCNVKKIKHANIPILPNLRFPNKFNKTQKTLPTKLDAMEHYG